MGVGKMVKMGLAGEVTPEWVVFFQLRTNDGTVC